MKLCKNAASGPIRINKENSYVVETWPKRASQREIIDSILWVRRGTNLSPHHPPAWYAHGSLITAYRDLHVQAGERKITRLCAPLYLFLTMNQARYGHGHVLITAKRFRHFHVQARDKLRDSIKKTPMTLALFYSRPWIKYDTRTRIVY